MSMGFNTNILARLKTRSNGNGGIKETHFLGIVLNDGDGMVFKCQ